MQSHWVVDPCLHRSVPCVFECNTGCRLRWLAVCVDCLKGLAVLVEPGFMWFRDGLIEHLLLSLKLSLQVRDSLFERGQQFLFESVSTVLQDEVPWITEFSLDRLSFESLAVQLSCSLLSNRIRSNPLSVLEGQQALLLEHCCKL